MICELRQVVPVSVDDTTYLAVSLKNGAPGSSSTVRWDQAGSNIWYVVRPSRMPSLAPVTAPITSPMPGSKPKSAVQDGASITPSRVTNSCTRMCPIYAPCRIRCRVPLSRLCRRKYSILVSLVGRWSCGVVQSLLHFGVQFRRGQVGGQVVCQLWS